MACARLTIAKIKFLGFCMLPLYPTHKPALGKKYGAINKPVPGRFNFNISMLIWLLFSPSKVFKNPLAY